MNINIINDKRSIIRKFNIVLIIEANFIYKLIINPIKLLHSKDYIFSIFLNLFLFLNIIIIFLISHPSFTILINMYLFGIIYLIYISIFSLFNYILNKFHRRR